MTNSVPPSDSSANKAPSSISRALSKSFKEGVSAAMHVVENFGAAFPGSSGGLRPMKLPNDSAVFDKDKK